MSDKLPRVRADRVLRALRRSGWFEHHRRGSHVYLRHPERPGQVTVPVHRGRDLLVKTLASILDQAGMSSDELRDLL
ncbi:MAG: type II toxin-antitoxin system HicA family toxin [Dehalococcoidia bacterium]